MTVQELRKEVSIELELIETILKELSDLKNDIGEREPAVREKTAAAAFLAPGGLWLKDKKLNSYSSISESELAEYNCCKKQAGRHQGICRYGKK